MTDLLTDELFDLQTSGGDFVTGRSDEQHQRLLLLSEKGAWKESPLVGVGLVSELENNEPADLLREIRLQFSADGMQVSKVNYDERTGKLTIDARYSTE